MKASKSTADDAAPQHSVEPRERGRSRLVSLENAAAAAYEAGCSPDRIHGAVHAALVRAGAPQLGHNPAEFGLLPVIGSPGLLLGFCSGCLYHVCGIGLWCLATSVGGAPLGVLAGGAYSGFLFFHGRYLGRQDGGGAPAASASDIFYFAGAMSSSIVAVQLWDAIVQAIDGDGRVSGPACAGVASLYLLLVPLPQVALAVLIWRRSQRAVASMPLLLYLGFLQSGVVLWCIARDASSSSSCDGGSLSETFPRLWSLLFSACWCVSLLVMRHTDRLKAPAFAWGATLPAVVYFLLLHNALGLLWPWQDVEPAPEPAGWPPAYWSEVDHSTDGEWLWQKDMYPPAPPPPPPPPGIDRLVATSHDLWRWLLFNALGVAPTVVHGMLGGGGLLLLVAATGVRPPDAPLSISPRAARSRQPTRGVCLAPGQASCSTRCASSPRCSSSSRQRRTRCTPSSTSPPLAWWAPS